MINWQGANGGGLRGEEVDRLVDHIRAWQTEGPAPGTVSAERGDARIGRAIYTASCAACHGAMGAGGIGPSLNTPTFLGIASDQYLARTILNGRPNTAMTGYRHFDAQQLSDLVAFMHTMWGIPDWLYYVSIALVLLASFLMFEGKAALRPGTAGRSQRSQRQRGSVLVSLPVLNAGDAPSKDRVNLMRIGVIRRFLLSRPARFVAQFSMAVAFILVIVAGLFGHQNPALNIAPLLTWTIWWCGLVVLIMRHS